MINNGHNIEKTNFDAFINAVGSEIQQAQVRLITAANAQMLFHYWKMGNYILYHQQLHGWGSKTIKQLAKAIRLNFSEKYYPTVWRFFRKPKARPFISKARCHTFAPAR